MIHSLAVTHRQSSPTCQFRHLLPVPAQSIPPNLYFCPGSHLDTIDPLGPRKCSQSPHYVDSPSVSNPLNHATPMRKKKKKSISSTCQLIVCCQYLYPSTLEDPSTFLLSHIMTESTSSHPPRDKPDATSENSRLTASASAAASELSNLKISLHESLRQFPDFPSPGILFEDILPIFADPTLHQSLIRALELHVTNCHGLDQKPDTIIGLEARGFLFGPSLALSLGAGFVPVRKPGKLPGPTETAGFKKEYGEDFFQIQRDAIKPGQRVAIVDDIIATGMPIVWTACSSR